MKRFIKGEGRGQAMLLPASLEDYAGEDNPVRVIDAFVPRQRPWNQLGWLHKGERFWLIFNTGVKNETYT